MTIGFFCFYKYKGKTIDQGEAQIDLRENKNKEIAEGVQLLFSLYLKACDTKLNNYSIKNFDENKKRKFEMLKNKYKMRYAPINEAAPTL